MNREMRRLAEREERRAKKQGQRQARRAAGKRPEERKPFHQRVLQFLREVRMELRRVSWPTREQMVAFTAVTLITSTALTLYTFALDFLFREGIIILLQAGSS